MQLTNLTSRIIPALLGLLLCTISQAQNILISEDFENANVSYTTIPNEFTDGSADFFTRTDGSNIASSYTLTGFEGNWFFAAQDVDGDQSVIPVQMEFTADISNNTDLNFSILLAEDSPNNKWDAPDYVKIDYSIDGGSYLPLIHIRNDGAQFNTSPQLDTDFDGIGDGALITSTFANYSASIPETGSSVTIRISINLDSGDEDIAFDNVLLTGMSVSDPGDSEPPVAVCAAAGTVTAELDENGLAVVNAEALDAGSTDNVAIASFESNPATFNCDDIGVQPVVLKVTDTNGNTATCTTDVQVVDVSAPVLSVNNPVTVYLDANGNVNLTAEMINNGSTDNCGINSLGITPNSLNCEDANHMNLLATSLIFSEYVEGSANNKYLEIYNGTGAPVNLEHVELFLFANGSIEPTAIDELEPYGILEHGESLVLGNSQASIYSGVYYSSVVAAFNGNDAISMATSGWGYPIDVFGIHGENPGTAWTNGEVSTLDHTLRRKKTVLSGNADNTNQNFLDEWEQFDQNDVSDLGQHSFEDVLAEVVFTAIDNAGNISSQSVTVNVIDTIPPQFLSQPENIYVTGKCQKSIEYPLPEVIDNCSGEVVIISDYPSGSKFDGGETLVTLTAIDPGGNTTQTQFSVILTTLPFEVEIVVYGQYICEGDSPTQPVEMVTLVSGGCKPFTYLWSTGGTDTRINAMEPGDYWLYVIDSKGDTAYATASLEGKPEIFFDLNLINPSCTDSTNGSFEITNITGATYPIDVIYDFRPDDPNLPNEFLENVYSVSDIPPGLNKIELTDDNFCLKIISFRTEIEDRTPPTAICGSTTLNLDASGTAILDPADLDAGSTDDCSASLSFSASQEIFDCTNLGENEVTLYVADDSLSTSTCVTTVTVFDNLAPELAVKSVVSFSLDDSGQVVIDPSLFDNGSVDNCGIVEYSVVPETLSCADISEGAPLADDLIMSEYLEGSSSNKYIEVYNGTGEAVDLSNYELRLYSNGSSTVSGSANLGLAGVLATGETAVFKNSQANIYAGSAYANSAVNFNGDDAVALYNTLNGQNADIFGIIGQDPGSYWSAQGINTLDHTLRRKSTVTSGNTNPADANFLDEWEQFSKDDVSGLGAHSFAAGGTEIIFTARDASGNSSSITVMATVTDTISPVFASFPDDITAYTDPATCSAIITWADPVVTDNCEATFNGDHTSGEVFEAGETLVTYTATDPSGNATTRSFTIMVSKPELSAEVVVDVYIHCHGESAEVHAQVSGGCEPYSYTWDDVAGEETQTLSAGEHTLTVTDASGGTASANITLTEPESLVVNITSVVPACGQSNDGEVSVTFLGGTAPYAIEWTGDATGSGNTLSNVGNGTYTATVTDANGCTTSESVTLNGTDLTPPVAVCQPATVYLDHNGQMMLDPTAIDGGSDEDCGSMVFSISKSTFDCSDLGENEVSLILTNDAGLTNTCTTTVTVVDIMPPVIIPTHALVSLDATGHAEVTIADFDNGSWDNCGIETIGITGGQVEYDCEDDGQTFAVTLTATDYSGNTSVSGAQVTVIPGNDSDGDGVSDSCDICEGDDSLGDADGDGICDELQQYCPGSEAITYPTMPCNYETTLTGSLYATGYLIYCVNGPFTNNFVVVAAGTTLRITGTGTIRATIAAHGAIEVMAGSDITFNKLEMDYNAKGLVVDAGATIRLNNFQSKEPVVNCGTIICNEFTLGYNSTFLNNGTLDCGNFSTENSSAFTNNGIVNASRIRIGYGSDFENNGDVSADQSNGSNTVDGSLINNGTYSLTGKLDLSYNGSVTNYCAMYVGKDFKVGRNVKNYGLIAVDKKTTLSYNGRVLQYDGAMFQTNATKISGRYIGYGAPSLVKVLGNTNADWNARVEGSIYFCDVNGIEHIQNPNGLTVNGAQKSCDLYIPVSECNPIGHQLMPSGLISKGDKVYTESDALTSEGNIYPSHGSGSTSVNGKMTAITIYPNPTEGKALIAFTPFADSGVTISVYTINGKKLQEFKPGDQIAGQPYEARLDLSKYDNGVYLIQIMDQERAETRKIVVAK